MMIAYIQADLSEVLLLGFYEVPNRIQLNTVLNIWIYTLHRIREYYFIQPSEILKFLVVPYRVKSEFPQHV
jgi:hypothetical protein